MQTRGRSDKHDIIGNLEYAKKTLSPKSQKKIWKKQDLGYQMEKRLQRDTRKIMGTAVGTYSLTVKHGAYL